MNWDDIKGLKYYIAYATIVIGFYVYSGWVGWKWFNPTQTTEETTTNRGGRSGHLYRYHK